ncbi:MAG: SpoIID/LytB domain protein [Candidatus Aminicenantes bacterium]|nr:SpoIID/LytB domain protein [Candidatus Aminicenantes bacterium]
MLKSRPRTGKYFFGAFAVLFFIAGKPPEFGQESQFFQGFLIQNPVIKVGLGVNLEEITIRATSGMKVYEVGHGYRLLADGVDEIQVRGHKEELTEKFIVQVGQTPKREEAEELAGRITPASGLRVYIVTGSEGREEGLYQVRIGDFLTRNEALKFIKTLNEKRLGEGWILREEVTEEESHPLWALVGDELETLSTETVVYFVPTDSRSHLSYKGTQYRGIFVLRASPKGLVLVNVLNLEDYLKGVVPEELSPDRFGGYEALKAQAVAARTYAIKNLGQNRVLGFDLCDSPKCQVYGGLSAERGESTRAVDETRGEVGLYKGKLINALYTSTCGGMTEDVQNVFEGQAQPYLKSTECSYEKQPEWVLESRPIHSIWMNGRSIERDAALLAGLGIIPRETTPAYYGEAIPVEEAAGWLGKALALVGKNRETAAPPAAGLNFPDLAGRLVAAFQWEDRVKILMLPSEVDFILRDFPPVRADARENIAFLIHSGVFPSKPGLADEKRMVTRGELVYVLSKAIRSYLDPGRKGILRGLTGKGGIILEDDRGEERIVPVSPDVFLFRSQDGEVFPASRLYFLGGEDIRWVANAGEVGYLEVAYATSTATLDRGSPFHRWLSRQTREELEKRVNEYYPIGRLQDFVIRERGKSRRVIEMEIVGTESQVVVRGLRVRTVLGLRDTLFTLDKEYDSEGRPSHYVFAGRGWGHGVGLCQVGASRMAQAGADYKEILRKYYQGIKISRYY